MRNDELLLLLCQISLHEEVATQLQVASQQFVSEWAVFDAASHQPLVEIDTSPKNRRKIAEIGCRAIDADLCIIESYWQSQSLRLRKLNWFGWTRGHLRKLKTWEKAFIR